MSVSSNQYFQILRTYWRRPLVLLLLFFFMLSVCFLAFGPSYGSSIFLGPRPFSPVRMEFAYTNLDDLNAEQRQSSQMQTVSDLIEQSKSEELRALNLVCMDVGDPLPDLSPFQNLEYLELSSFELTPKNVEQICQLPKLDALVLSNIQLPEGSLQRIGQKVSQLEMSAQQLETYSNDIPQMSRVKLLALQVLNASPDLIEHVTKIPKLEQLTLLPVGDRSDSKTDTCVTVDLNEDQIALIRNHPTLKEVYADWFWMKRQGNFDENRFLPVRALPVVYPAAERNAMSRTCIAAGVLFALLALQLWAQFITPVAHVVPNYLVPHRRVAVGVFMGGVILLWLSLLQYEFSFLSNLCLILIAPAICCSFFLVHLTGRNSLQWLSLPITISLILLLSILSVSGFQIVESNTIWFLRGQMLWLALSIIAGSILVIAATLTRLPAITRMANETYTTTPAFSPWDRARNKKWQGVSKNYWFLNKFDSTTHGLRYRSRSTFQMANLWRLGNLFRPRVVLVWMLWVALFSLVPQTFLILSRGEGFHGEDFRWLAGVCSGPFGVGLFFPALMWWQRCQNLEAESLRPVDRRALSKQLYLALAWDHWLVVLGLLGLVAFRAFTAPGFKNEVTGMFFLLGVAAPLWILGVNATVLVCKRAWVVVGTMIALYSIASSWLGTVIAFGSDNLPGTNEDLRLLLIAAVTAIAAGIGLNVLMYRAVLEREWG